MVTTAMAGCTSRSGAAARRPRTRLSRCAGWRHRPGARAGGRTRLQLHGTARPPHPDRTGPRERAKSPQACRGADRVYAGARRPPAARPSCPHPDPPIHSPTGSSRRAGMPGQARGVARRGWTGESGTPGRPGTIGQPWCSVPGGGGAGGGGRRPVVGPSSRQSSFLAPPPRPRPRLRVTTRSVTTRSHAARSSATGAVGAAPRRRRPHRRLPRRPLPARRGAGSGCRYAWPLLPAPQVRTPFRAPEPPTAPGTAASTSPAPRGRRCWPRGAGRWCSRGRWAGGRWCPCSTTTACAPPTSRWRQRSPRAPSSRPARCSACSSPAIGLPRTACTGACAATGRYLDPLVLLRPARVRLLPVPVAVAGMSAGQPAASSSSRPRSRPHQPGCAAGTPATR